MKYLFINWKINLIQQVRLIQALGESDYKVCIRNEDLPKFKVAQEHFKLDLYPRNQDSIDITDALKFSHQAPLTRIGKLERALIFPRSIANKCRNLWPSKRTHKVAFIGLVTEKRKDLINAWIKDNCKGTNLSVTNFDSTARRIKNRLFRIFGLSNDHREKIDQLLFWFSDRGRVFPIKGWDQRYFENLADAEFILCPSGDCVWSYRFFEAIFCGAIPIVEQNCRAYEGFKFYTFSDKLDQLSYSERDAQFNFELCVAKLTIPKEELNRTIQETINQFTQSVR